MARTLLRIRTDIVDLGPISPPTPDKTQAKNGCGGAHKPAQTDADGFRTGVCVFRPQPKTFELRDSLAEIGPPDLFLMHRARWPDPLVTVLGPTLAGELPKINDAGVRSVSKV